MSQIFFRIWLLLVLSIIDTVAQTTLPSISSEVPTIIPTKKPSPIPSKSPSFHPTNKPTKKPSPIPSKSPSFRPTNNPTKKPSPIPSKKPSFRPTRKPTQTPSKVPSISPTGVSAWSQVNMPGDAVTNPILLTNGRVMLFGKQSRNVYLLAPDSFGKYKTGVITQIASLPAGYCPLYFGSATLPDGRVIIAGGEYNCGGAAVWTNRAAIYNPLTNVWTSIAPPLGSNKIGDAATIVLPDGTFLLQDFYHWNAVVLNAATLTWTRKQFNNKQTS